MEERYSEGKCSFAVVLSYMLPSESYQDLLGRHARKWHGVVVRGKTWHRVLPALGQQRGRGQMARVPFDGDALTGATSLEA